MVYKRLFLLLINLFILFLVVGQFLFPLETQANTLKISSNHTLYTQTVTVSPGYEQMAYLDTIISYTHILTNLGSMSDTFFIDIASSQNWLVNLQGSLSESTLVGTGSLQESLQVEAELTQTLVVNLSIPANTMSGTIDIMTTTITAQSNPTVNATIINTTTVQSKRYTLFMPWVSHDDRNVIKVGVDFNFMTTDPEVLEHDLPLVKETGTKWVRYWLSWPRIETSPGIYNWDQVDNTITNLHSQGFNVLLVVYGAPDWAAEFDCGPISDITAFEAFLEIALTRYGINVDAWEFINEPDGVLPPHKWSPEIGCWASFPEEYAAQLGIFYQKVKMFDPTGLVFFGGLSYDNWTEFNRDFFENTLQHGAGTFFDGVSAHYYPINPNEFPTMAHKINELQAIMLRNGVTGKRIWITETAAWTNGHMDQEKQRDFIVKEFARGFCNGVDNIFWFDIREIPPERLGFLDRWLIDSDHQPAQAYDTFKHLVNSIVGSACGGAYQNVPEGIEAYRFTGAKQTLYILWSVTEGQEGQNVEIPAFINATLANREGNDSTSLTILNDHVQFEVGATPVFVTVDATQN